MPSVNLAPGTQYLRAVRRRQRRLLLLAVLIVVFVGGVWGGLILYNRSLQEELAGVEGQLRTVEVEIAKLDTVADRIILFENRLKILDGLLDQHISWDTVLTSIEELLPPGTVLTGVTVRSDSGEIQFQGKTDNIDSVALVIASLKASAGHETIFKAGSLNGVIREATLDAEGGEVVRYGFSGSLQFSPGILASGS